MRPMIDKLGINQDVYLQVESGRRPLNGVYAERAAGIFCRICPVRFERARIAIAMLDRLSRRSTVKNRNDYIYEWIKKDPELGILLWSLLPVVLLQPPTRCCEGIHAIEDFGAHEAIRAYWAK